MKANQEILYTPAIVACTAHNLENIKQKCIDAGMNDVIIKPCPKESVISIVMSWIEKYKNLINC